ncbi:hypothetical protein A0H81_10979 [Grifola frondosa]|uniref:Uncharacterized protein n=1 Tax=Grifola frondosa TaxID=5627 RepID=A0A1C7LYF3_GRIFR|nr:hypothetical protein A0H81_10979 [Grifola frondosa]
MCPRLTPNYTLLPANLTFPSAPSSPSNYSIHAPHRLRNAQFTCGRRHTGQCIVEPGPVAARRRLPAVAMARRRAHSTHKLYGIRRAGPDEGEPADKLRHKIRGLRMPYHDSPPFCPSTGYVVPIPVPPDPAMGHTAQTIRADTSATMLANFTTMLTMLACGRDKIGLDAIYHQAELLQLERGDGHYRARTLEHPPEGVSSVPGAHVSSSPPLLAPLQPLSHPSPQPADGRDNGQMLEVRTSRSSPCLRTGSQPALYVHSGLREIHDDGAGLCGWGCAGVGLGLDPDEEISLYALVDPPPGKKPNYRCTLLIHAHRARPDAPRDAACSGAPGRVGRYRGCG